MRGARQHNLKNIDVEIPRNTLTVITGLSGSGKSSLAFDTIYAEGQRRYVETLSAYARQFLDQMERPDVDSIDGLSPSISIEQKTTSRSPRSTVGTITEIYDYLRLLYSSIGVPHCPNCGKPITRQSAEQIVQRVMSLTPDDRVMIMAPIVRGRKGEFKKEMEKLDPARFLPRPRRWRTGESGGRPRARQAQEPHHRSRRGSPAGEARNRTSPRTLRRAGHETRRRPRPGRGRQRRRNALLLASRLPRLRHQRSATGAAIVLVQQFLWSLPRVPRPRKPLRSRSRQGDCRLVEAAARWRPGPRFGIAEPDSQPAVGCPKPTAST